MRLQPVIAWIVGIGLLCTAWYYQKNPLSATATIRGVTYRVDVAVTPKEKEIGLGGRDSLPDGTGMLFPYDHAEQFSYWMKGMRFPIDIIWIRDFRIVDISKNVPIPIDGTLPVYAPREPVNLVLEIASGESDTHGFQIGDTVSIKN